MGSMLNLFLVLSYFSVALATAVVVCKNPIDSLLCLVGTYLFTSLLFLWWGCEYLSLLLIFVYLGAIAILFLFVIMLLNITSTEVSSVVRFPYLWFLFGLVLLVSLLSIVDGYYLPLSLYSLEDYLQWCSLITTTKENNILSIAYSFYTDYSIEFLVLSLILLTSLISSIFIIFSIP